MKTRKTIAILGTGLILACCAMIYIMLDITLFPLGYNKSSVKDNQWLHFESRLAKLEQDLIRHHEAMTAQQDTFFQPRLISPPELQHVNPRFKIVNDRSKKPPNCSFDMSKNPQVDIQMLQVYKELEFDNPDGGAWKQGWNIKYDEKQWHPNRKLKVFVVPHSHNDPGWLNTFETYYNRQTQRILNNMVTQLASDGRRKFIWAEISFFKLWWDEQNDVNRETVKRLINDGQLEIVAGGWVMPDESVSHWIAQLTQLTEGHQWLKSNLNFIPKNGWAIDPFGLSPTMPLLLKGSGLENLAIQRVHYSVKKKLAREKKLEFRWRQLWDNDGRSEFFTHMMPFYSYDIPHTCGPDPKVCCQFDFFRLPHFGLSCPWKISPKMITNQNVAERANLLLDQYRKKAQLYKTNTVLAPLGDDFRYSQSLELEEQYRNYQKLFDYMNKNKQLNVEIKFGTLSDYFDAVRKAKNIEEFPTLSGDFFTYSDRDDHYWSGYYTSRPFHKRLDRVLLGSLRAAESLSTIAWIRGNDQLAEGSIAHQLSEARRWHSLFQHHDGISGTARDNVVIDYAQKMIKALNNSAHILQQSIAHLLKSPQNFPLNTDEIYFTLDETRSHYTSSGDKKVLLLGDDYPAKKIILYNPLPREITRVQTIQISVPRARVTDRMGQPIQCQISPIWVGSSALSAAKYELSFLITVPGFGLTTYLIHSVNENSLPREMYLANVTLYNSAILFAGVPGFTNPQIYPSSQEFTITQRPELSASFSEFGFLKALKVGHKTVPVHLEFVKYGTRGPGADKSGAYLFLPDRPSPDPVSIDNDRIVHLISGPIVTKVYVESPYVRHTCALFNSPGSDGLGLQIFNEIDISETQNFELAMRLDTDIESGDQFFTDLNGLNMIRRQRFSKIPIQGNYYPLPTAGYIEDERVRLTILSAQPLGAASMASGQFEIMQDRRLMQDDNRGLGQGVTDNLLTNHLFTIVLEEKRPSCQKISSDNPAGILSLAANLASEELLHPVIVAHPRASLPVDLNASLSPLLHNLPVDLNVASLRIFPVPEGAGKSVGIVLHRSAIDLCWGEETVRKRFKVSETGEVDFNKFLSYTEDWTVSDAPLTFHSVGPSRKSSVINLCPHQILPTLLHRTQF